MFTRMLTRDARRNAPQIVTLVALMALSVVLATASVGLLARVMGASSSLLERADAPDVSQMHSGPVDEQVITSWVEGRDDVAAHQVQVLLGIDGSSLTIADTPQGSSVQQNSLVLPPPERDRLLMLDDTPLTEVEPGSIWLPVYYMAEHATAVGDVVTITGRDGYRLDLTIAGFVRDSTMNPAITSSKRLAVSQQDMADVAQHTGTPEFLISFWLDDPAATQSFMSSYQDSDMPGLGPIVSRDTFLLFNSLSDGLVAGVVVMAALALLVVGLLCVRLSFLTTLEREKREVGVLAAIGVPSSRIRRLYLVKYGTIVGVATVVGLLGGYALAPAISRQVSLYMGDVASIWNWLAPALAALLVLVLALGSVALMLRRVSRLGPVEALRDTPATKRRHGPRMRLHRSRILPVNVHLGVGDVLRSAPRYGLLLMVFAVSAFIVAVPAAAATTVGSQRFTTAVGISDGDLLVTADPNHAEELRALTEAVSEGGTAVIRTTTRMTSTDPDGEPVSIYVEAGDHTRLPVTYGEGRAPTADDEVALSYLTAAALQAGLGDQVTIGDHSLRVVGTYQDITNGGVTAKALVDDGEVMWHAAAVALPAETEPADIARQWTSPGIRAVDVETYRDQTLGPLARQITTAATVATVAAIALVVLMTAMFVRLLLASERAQIAIHHALGNPGVLVQYLTRFLVVLTVGVPVGVIAALTAGQSTFNLLLEGLLTGLEGLGQGTSRVQFVGHGLLTGVALPAALIVAVILTTWFASRAPIQKGHLS